MITPSTMISGSAPPMIELVPRSRTETPPPGLPVLLVISAPETFPWSAWSTVTAGVASSWVSLTLVMAFPMARRAVGAVVPVTTSSSSSSADSARYTAGTWMVASPPSSIERVSALRPMNV